MSDSTIKPKSPFFNTSMLSKFLDETCMENILRFDDFFLFHKYETENPASSNDIIEELFKIIKICIETESIELIEDITEIVNILDVNKGLLNIRELLSIERIFEFGNAYPNIFNFHMIQMDIPG